MSETENDDFFLDEDFLQDLDQTSQLYYSQIENTEEHVTSNKRRKLNHEDVDVKPVVSKFASKKTINKTQVLSSKKNLILDIFENNSSPKTSEQSTSKLATSSLSIRNKSSPRSDSIMVKQNLSSSLITKKSVLEMKARNNHEPERNQRESSPRNPTLLRTSSDMIQLADDTSQPLKATSDTDNLFKTPFPHHPKTLVRRFPGPAGLIPVGLKEAFKDTLKDTLKDNLVDDAICYLQNLDDEMNMSNPSDTTLMSEFCSQETKKLFSNGAWRRMLDDLPKNYLRGHDIASLKRPGRPNKIPLLAAVIHSIEHNAADPRIVLKDISNSVEAIMHKDIPSKYPNILQSGVVLLLRDIGVLSFQGAKRYSTISVVMISPKSVLGAYSDKERLVTTPALNEILKRDCSTESSQINNNAPRYNVAASEISDKKYSRPKRDKHKSRYEAKMNREDILRDLENINPIENFDDMSDLDFDEPFAAFQRNDVQSSTLSTDGDDGRTIVTRAIVEVPPNSLSPSVPSIPSTVTDDDPTEIVNPSESPTISPSTGFGDDLFNDTDDEILSQFDVDSIANSHIHTRNNKHSLVE